MKFDLDAIYIEDACRDTALAKRVLARAASVAPVSFVADGRAAALPPVGGADSFAAGKRRMVIMRRRSPFLMACPGCRQIRVLRIFSSHARVELPDGLQLLLPAGVRRG